jgi:Flp pilus assembly protein TadD
MSDTSTRLDVAAEFSAEELNALHRVAHALYSQGLYDDAVRYYWFLTLHAPRNMIYLQGMSASLFMAKRFAEAVLAYSLLTQLAPEDPQVLCMCGHALLMQGELRDARQCLECAAALPGDSQFAARAAALLTLIHEG